MRQCKKVETIHAYTSAKTIAIKDGTSTIAELCTFFCVVGSGLGDVVELEPGLPIAPELRDVEPGVTVELALGLAIATTDCEGSLDADGVRDEDGLGQQSS